MLGMYYQQQVKNFVILFVGRSGSSYLADLIDAHPNIRCQFDQITELMDEGAEAQLIWARENLKAPVVGRNRAIGYKTKPANILDIDGFTSLLYENQCHIIELTRYNRIKGVISYLNGQRLAEATGMWGLFDETNRPTPFSIDPDEFGEVLKRREKGDNDLKSYVSSLSLPQISLCYEDLLRDRDAVMKKIFSFLYIPSKQVKGKSFKVTSDNLREIVVNFDALRAQYKGTEYVAMFDEIIVS